MSYLRPRLASVKLHPLRLKEGERGKPVCGWRLCASSNKRRAEARGEEGKDGEEAKGQGGETRGDCSLWFSRPEPWIPLSLLWGDDRHRLWEQFPELGGVTENESQLELSAWDAGLTSSSPGERYLMSASSTWKRKVRMQWERPQTVPPDDLQLIQWNDSHLMSKVCCSCTVLNYIPVVNCILPNDTV